MNSKIYLFMLPFLFTVFSSSLHGQKQVVPGYQGKRILLGAYYNFMSAAAGPKANGKGWYGDIRSEEESIRPFAFSGRFDLNASYVLSRRLTGTFSLGHGQTGIGDKVFLNPSTSFETTNSAFFSVGYSFAAIGLQMQRKKRWGIAPMGPYWGIRYIATINHQPKLKLIAKEYDSNYSSIEECDCTWERIPTDNPKTSLHPSKIFHDVEIQFGIRDIIKEHYYYDMAITTVPAGWYANDYDDDNYTFDTRLRRLYSINLRIGVGKLF